MATPSPPPRQAMPDPNPPRRQSLDSPAAAAGSQAGTEAGTQAEAEEPDPEADEAAAAQAYVRRLHAYLEPRMLRRMKASVLAGQIPDKTTRRLPARMTPLQMRLYVDVSLRGWGVERGWGGGGPLLEPARWLYPGTGWRGGCLPACA